MSTLTPPRKRSSTSARQRAANRKNALNSTGPRTDDGKAKSSLNALKHGLCSDSNLLPGECPNTYFQVLAEFEEELQPKTVIQKMKFRNIVNLYWKIRAASSTPRFTSTPSKPSGPHPPTMSRPPPTPAWNPPSSSPAVSARTPITTPSSSSRATSEAS